ncbi:MAG TPA: hypothetical protein VF384_18515 [Planctomycetota bacterium]
MCTTRGVHGCGSVAAPEVVPLELGAGGAITAVSSSNALVSTIGSY